MTKICDTVQYWKKNLVILWRCFTNNAKTVKQVDLSGILIRASTCFSWSISSVFLTQPHSGFLSTIVRQSAQLVKLLFPCFEDTESTLLAIADACDTGQTSGNINYMAAAERNENLIVRWWKYELQWGNRRFETHLSSRARGSPLEGLIEMWTTSFVSPSYRTSLLGLFCSRNRLCVHLYIVGAEKQKVPVRAVRHNVWSQVQEKVVDVDIFAEDSGFLIVHFHYRHQCRFCSVCVFDNHLHLKEIWHAYKRRGK